MIYGIITVDYEDFIKDNHKWNAMNNIIVPANKIMDFFDSYGIPVTFYCNVAEYIRMEQLGHCNAKLLYEHMNNIMKRGHEIQMHFHERTLHVDIGQDGQWKKSDFVEGDNILLRNIPEFEQGVRILRSINPDTNSYRGGGYLIEPIYDNFTYLHELGFKTDSSLGWSRRSKNFPPFLVNIHGLTEVPICKVDGIRWDMSASPRFVYAVNNIINNYQHFSKDMFIVMMGHTKQKIFWSDMTEILNIHKHNIHFITMSQVAT